MAKGEAAAQIAYMVCNGIGKSRGTRDGGVRETRHWRTMGFSTGEQSLESKLAEEDIRQKAGQEVRLLDVEADIYEFGVFAELHGAAHGAAFSDRINAAAAAAHGSAGRAFVAALVADLEHGRRAGDGVEGGVRCRGARAVR